MTKKCKGCGALLQTLDLKIEGYTKNIDNDLCERCFKIKNYNEYQKVDKKNSDFVKILEEINKTNDLVILLIDLFNIPREISNITKYLNNKILLVYTKRDIFSYKINDEKFLNYNLDINCIDKLIISSKNNYNFDILLEKINYYKNSKNVYIVGFTNSGKSTLINKLVKNYTSKELEIVTSNLPSTTLDLIKIELNDELTIIDTPGILEEKNIFDAVTINQLKRIIPKREIKPITYQMRSRQYIFIENLLILEASNNNLTFYISNDLKITRTYKDIITNLKEREIMVKGNQDLVIVGLGFIKVTKNETIKIYGNENIDIYVRESLI